MRLSAFLPYQLDGLARLRTTAGLAQRLGYERVWLGQSTGLDALVAVSAIAHEFPGLRFGTAVTGMHMRHPLQSAVEARSVAAVTGRQFTLGLGVGDPESVRDALGLDCARPATFAREYLQVVSALLDNGRVDHAGDVFRVRAEPPPCAGEVELALGVLRPGMGRVGGELADTCVTWLTPPGYLRDVLIPAVHEAAARCGRTAPRIVTIVPCSATSDRGELGAVAAHAFGQHVGRPHYRAALDLAGHAGAADDAAAFESLTEDVMAYGSARRIAATLDRYEAAGVDEVVVGAYLAGPRPEVHYVDTLAAVAVAVGAVELAA